VKKNLESTKLKNIVEIIQKNCISKERKTNGAVFWKKHKKQIPAWILAGIQLLFFVFFPSAFTAAFSGVKYIAGQMGTGAQIEITSFVLSLIILCASTVVFGRFFCGFACAFGSLSDWVRAAYVWVCKKLKEPYYKKLPKRRKPLREAMLYSTSGFISCADKIVNMKPHWNKQKASQQSCRWSYKQLQSLLPDSHGPESHSRFSKYQTPYFPSQSMF